jgi:hypothetical protein
MPMKIFEYAVLYHPLPTKDQIERGEQPRSLLVVDVTRVVAKDQSEVQMLAARAIPEEYTNKLDRLEVAVRPF